MKIIYNVKAMEGGFLVKEGIRREYKKQYDASTKRIDVVDVPEFNFLMVDGIGNPNVEEFKLKAEALHILSKAIKDYFKEEMDLLYLISPLEGLWDTYDNSQFDVTRKKMIKFTFKQQIITTAIVLLGTFLVSILLKQGIFFNLGWIVSGLMFVVNPVYPDLSVNANLDNIEKSIRVVGIVLVAIGLSGFFGA